MLPEFEYNVGNNPELFRISASQFSTFVERPWQYYKEHVLGIGGFEGNTASTLGTIIHAIAERTAKGMPTSRDDIEEYLNTITDSDIDKEEIRYQYPIMSKVLMNDYVLKYSNSMYEVEPFLELDLGDGISTGGSIDRVEAISWGDNKQPIGARIVDYKSYNSKTKPSSIPKYYKYQLLVYAYVYSKLRNTPVEEVRLVYVNRYIDGGISSKTGKPLKSYDSEVTILTEQIHDEDLTFIESLIYLAKDKLLATEKYPELTHLLWHYPLSYIENTP